MQAFESVFYFINPSLPTPTKTQHQHLLSQYKASPCPLPSPIQLQEHPHWRFDIERVTLVITDTLDFPEVEDVRNRRPVVNIVTPEFVERCSAVQYWQDPKYFSADPNKFFSGTSICCAPEISQADKDVISAGVQAWGGQFKKYLTKEVTHLICNSPIGDHYEIALQNKSDTDIRIVLPHWFDTCINLTTRVPEEAYEFPDPLIQAHPSRFEYGMPLLNHPPTANQEALFQSFQERVKPRGLEHPLENKKVFFADDLDLGDRTATLQKMVTNSGGIVVASAEKEEYDVYIGKFRDGESYYKAVRQGKVIGSLKWLHYLCSDSSFVSPKKALLHYPVPRTTIPEFEKFSVTLTNYSGDSRDYLKQLVLLMGGEYTPDFSRKNTHVVAATKHGAKVRRAADWSIPVVNHNWLEECFVKWQSFGPYFKDIFTLFPPGFNYMTVICDKGLTDTDLEPWTTKAWGKVSIKEEAEKTNPHAERSTVVSAKAAGPSISVLPSTSTLIHASSSTVDQIPPTHPMAKAVEPLAQPHPLSESSSIAAPSAPTSTAPLRRTHSSTVQPRGAGPSLLTSTSSEDPLAMSLQPRPNRAVPAIASANSPLSTETTTAVHDDPPAKRPTSRLKSPEPHPAPTSSGNRLSSPPPLPFAAALLSMASPSKTPYGRPPASAEDHPPSSHLPTPLTFPSTPATNPPSSYRKHNLSGLSPDAILPPSSRRKEKDKATKKLHDEIAPDMNKYQKELHNGTLITGTRQERLDDRLAAKESARRKEKKRKVVEEKEEEEEEEDELEEEEVEEGEDELERMEEEGEEEERPKKPASSSKKRRKNAEGEVATPASRPLKKGKVAAIQSEDRGNTPLPRSTSRAKGRSSTPAAEMAVKIIMTQATLTDSNIKKLAKIGATIVIDPAVCTHLVANKIVRTKKFLCSLSVAPVIVTLQWVTDSIKAQALQDVEPYILHDEASEEIYEFELQESIRQARELVPQGGLLKDKLFFATRNIGIEYQLFKEIIESSGGALSNKIPRMEKFTDSPDTCFLISSEEDKDLWMPFKKKSVSIYSKELVLMGVLTQKLEFGKHALGLS